MGITKQELEQAFEDHAKKYGGCKEDYFGLLYLSKEFDLPPHEIAHQVAFGGNDYGIDAFHVDRNLRNLYLYQFKWSENYGLFKSSFARLTNYGMDRIFGNPLQDQNQNQLLIQLKNALHENQAAIDRVIIYFVFNGDPSAAEQSSVMDALRENLESKKYLIDQFFEGKQVDLTFQFRSNETKKIAAATHTKKTYKFPVSFRESFRKDVEGGEQLHVGILRLMDLQRIHQEMGPRFFERNIRSGLNAEKAPNRAIRQALKAIVLDRKESPDVFLFNHNGVSMAVERILEEGGSTVLVEPRLLNGAQTVSSLKQFLEENQGNELLKRNSPVLESIEVLAKVVWARTNEFIVNVTICNNRQNPVEPWNLRANDSIQLDLQDKFREDLQVYYERQENAFSNLTDEERDDMGIEQYKAVEMKRLGQTFLAGQGEIDKMSRLPDVFENENIYKSTFRESYLKSDSRKILLVYKIQFRLRGVVKEIIEKGQKYGFLMRARNLVWALLAQGLLNSEKLQNYLEEYGTQLAIEADFNELLKDMASRKVRLIINDTINSDENYGNFIKQEKYEFLRNRATFQRCMDTAYGKYGWVKKSF